MKKLLSCFFALLFSFLFTSGQIYSLGFNSIHTPDGINVIAVGDEGRIYRSANAGNTWASYTINADDFRSVFSLDNDVWIAGDNGNIYKTQKTNSPVSTYNVGASFSINSIYFSSLSVGYLCGDAGNIYKTINGGLDWTPVNSGISNVKLNSISFIDDMKGCVVGDNGTIYLTDDGGSSWTSQTSGTSRNLLKTKYFTEGIITVGEYGVILTKENTGNWTDMISRTDSDIRGITGTAFNTARVCGGGGFIRNNSNGSSDFFNFEINPMMANLVDIFYYNSNLGFAVSSLNQVIIRTTNGGVSWDLPAGTAVTMNWVLKSPSGGGIGNNLCLHPKNRDSYFVVYGNKVFVSRDKGDTWSQIATISIGSRAHSFYVSPNDTNVWLAAMESSPDCVVRTTNYGATWTSIIARDFSSYGQPLEMDQNNPSVFYFAPSNGSGIGVFKSTDNGATFNLTAPYNNSTIGQPCDLIVMWDSSNVLYMGDDGADILKSVDYGVTWTTVKPSSSSEVPSMCNSVFDQKMCYATTWSSSQVYKTVNYGDSWSVASVNSGSGWGSDVCREDPTVVLTGNYGSQSYLSTNGGTTFSSVNSGLGGAGAGIMVPDRGIYLNMQTGSLYKLNIVYTTLTNINENNVSTIPSSFELYQNYPNPFNPTTNIKFSLPTSGNISLKVYNQLGKEVSTLSDGFRAAGTYEINFDATNLNSGVYFYKLITNELSSTKKMLLIK